MDAIINAKELNEWLGELYMENKIKDREIKVLKAEIEHLRNELEKVKQIQPEEHKP